MEQYWEDARATIRRLSEDPPDILSDFVRDVIDTWDSGGKVISFGNGGSAADSLHFTAELVGRFREEVIQRPAISLVSNPSTLTAVSNDWSYDEIFARQLRSQALENDLVLGISTSGNSENVIKGLQLSTKMNITSYGLTGEDPGTLGELPVNIISVSSNETSHIQEAHITCLHYVCWKIEEKIGGEG